MSGIYTEKIFQCHYNITKLLRCVLLQHNIVAGHYFNSFPNEAMRHYLTVINLAHDGHMDISDKHQTLVK